jgi:CheY-like chemotaxis protein
MGGKYEVIPTRISDLIEKSSNLFGRTRKEITIHSKYQENEWSVEVDQGQIEQVLLNLYVNAWQAMPGGGELFLETENVVLDEAYATSHHARPGKYVLISVSDTGVGMDKWTQERIFEPFFTTREMGRGTGLGLASAYGIIRSHDGIITVRSEIGAGTTFAIYLPSSEKEITKETGFDDELLFGTEGVLLVDDEIMITDVGERLLERLGYVVYTANNGKEALEIFDDKRDQIDLVILDMIMPEMNGGEVYNRLKARDAEIKTILSSGYSADGEAAEILGRGCDGFIQKPYSLNNFSKKLREVLDKN